ncbi:MAG: NPCBM/NEW2 domain-containing protein [Candidatus Hydrogenedentes bacterium]|nr:NPCBM/NEW2 domain-containing protein [Candidatus Hydrogenedentota bacterium]
MLTSVRLTGIAFMLFAAGLVCAETPPATDGTAYLPANEILKHVVYHKQGWGLMGIDTCVFAPGAEPQPLRIGVRDYAAGLGLHSPGETWLALEKRYVTFEAEVGVQKQANNQGSVEFRVYADNALVFESGVMRESDPAKPIHLDVTGVHFLRLEITDAGDGITCDCANWVNLRLVPAEAAADSAATQYEPVDIAPFGRVLTWNPYIKDGTHAQRTEEFPARDLFPGSPVARGEDGAYPIPLVQHPHADMGMGCIGLEWLEQRRIREAEVHFVGDAPASVGVAVEYWAMTPAFDGTPGVSRWQGHWERLVADIVCEGNRWSVTVPQAARGWQRPKTMKLRWIIPRELGRHRIERLSAYTDSDWQEADITLRALQPTAGQEATLTMYNGTILDENEGVSRTWSMAEPLHIRVRYAAEQPWTRGERTVLRFSTPSNDFGIAVGDVLESGCVYVESAGIVATPAERESEADAYVAACVDKRTILEEVRQLPDQTFAQALERVHRPEADYGPTLLSLAHGNEKFLVQRNGAIGFDVPGEYKGQVRAITPKWEGQSNGTIQRHLDGGWMPIPVVTHQQGGVTVQQRTFVAPCGETETEGKAEWYHDKPLCVAECTFNNPGDAAEMNLTWSCKAEADLALREHARGIVIESAGQFIALLDTTGAPGFRTQVEGADITLSGSLPAAGTASCVLLIPGWQAAPEVLPPAGEAESLLEATREHWRNAMKGSIRITTPDEMLNNLIAASRVHCMLAARNEEGERIAPWIASTHYGPLESEAHSIVRGMEFMGHRDFARRGLDFFINRYNDDGYLTTGYTLIGTGWHLWALGEYSALYQDREWLTAIAPEVSRVCNWILAQRKKTMIESADGQRPPEYGLMPPGVLADWGVYSHYFYLNGNYYAGLKSAGDALAAIGWDNAESILENAAAFREDIARAFRYVQEQAPVLPLRDGTWAPPYPTQLYCPMPVADMYVDDDVGRSWCYDVELGAHHLVPMGVLDAKAPEVTWMMDHMEDVQFLESGWFYYPEEGNKADWFNLGGFAKVQPYYARNAEVCALRDDVKPFIRSYFNAVVSLLNREDLSLWEHFMNGAFNKTHETGYFLYQSRLMLVMERGNALWLAPFVPAQWLEEGKTVDVQDAPTFFGPTGFTIASHLAEGYVEATITPPKRQTPDEIVIRLRHPQGKRMSSAEVDGTKDFRVSPDDSTVHITPGQRTITVKARYEE